MKAKVNENSQNYRKSFFINRDSNNETCLIKTTNKILEDKKKDLMKNIGTYIKPMEKILSENLNKS